MRAATWMVLVVLLFACERYAEPNTPLPPLKVTHTDGRPLDLAAYRGRPLVLNLWLPG